MNNRIRYIDFEKGICILIVLYIHLTQKYLKITELSFLHRLCIPQFALIAGYNLSHSENKETINTIILSLSKMIYIYFVTLIVTQLVFFKSVDIENAINIMISGSIIPQYNVPMWYVPHYMSLFLISFLILKINYTIKRIMENMLTNNGIVFYEFIIVTSILFATLGFIYEGTNLFYIKQSLVLVPFVMIGYLINKIDIAYKSYTLEIDKRRKITLYAIVFFAFVVFLIFFIVFTTIDGYIDIFPFLFNNKIIFYISTICGGICLFILSKLICSIIIFDFITNLVSYIGRKSIYICCFSIPIQEIIFKRFNNIFKSFEDGSVISLLIKISLVTVFSICFSYVFESEKNYK